MKQKITLLLCGLIVAGSLSLTSCATMFGKASFPLSIYTDPSGADIYITNQKGQAVYSGQSPVTVVLKSSGGYMKAATYNVELSYPGYKTQNIAVTSKLNGWYWGNIFLGGLIGMLIVDPLSGSMYKLDNAPIDIVLPKAYNYYDNAEVVKQKQLNIVNINDVPEELKEYLIKVN